MSTTNFSRLSRIPAWIRISAKVGWILWFICISDRISGATNDLFRPNDRIVFLGGTFAERLNQAGYFEAMLTSRLPSYRLSFRNLGFSADQVTRDNEGNRQGEPWLMPRSLEFGSLKEHLRAQKPDILFLCFGMMESYSGPEGLRSFVDDLKNFTTNLLSEDYSGRGFPKCVFVTPIPHEAIGGRLPPSASHNRSLVEYSKAMVDLGRSLKIPVIDLNSDLALIFERKVMKRLTINGIHLNQMGNWYAALAMMESLGLPMENIAHGTVSGAGFVRAKWLQMPILPFKVGGDSGESMERFPKLVLTDLPEGHWVLRSEGKEIAGGTSKDWTRGVPISAGALVDQSTEFLRAIEAKNWEWMMRWRAVNGEYIYGRRKGPFGTNTFPPEFVRQQELIAEKEKRIAELNRDSKEFMFELRKLD